MEVTVVGAFLKNIFLGDKYNFWDDHRVYLNSFAPGMCRSNFGSVMSEQMLQINFMGTCEIALRWMLQNIFDDNSKLVLAQVVAWCRWISDDIS